MIIRWTNCIKNCSRKIKFVAKPEIKQKKNPRRHCECTLMVGNVAVFLSLVHGQQREKISMSEGKKNLIKISFSAFFPLNRDGKKSSGISRRMGWSAAPRHSFSANEKWAKKMKLIAQKLCSGEKSISTTFRRNFRNVARRLILCFVAGCVRLAIAPFVQL